jgi:hypothetical protein
MTPDGERVLILSNDGELYSLDRQGTAVELVGGLPGAGASALRVVVAPGADRLWLASPQPGIGPLWTFSGPGLGATPLSLDSLGGG